MTSVAQYPSSIQAAANQQLKGHQGSRSTVPAPPSVISTHHPRAAMSSALVQVLNLPATANPFASLSIPQLKPAPANPGYNEAHQYYDEMRKYYSSKAYTSAATAELVIVKVRLVTLEPKKKNPTFISVGVFLLVYLYFFCLLILTIGISESI